MEGISANSDEWGSNIPQSSGAPSTCPSERRNGRGGAESPIKIEHAIVLRTLKAANLASRRVVTNPEIVQAFSGNEITLLKISYQQDIGTVVGKVLTLLRARGLVFSPGKIGNNRYYGASAILTPDIAALPNEQTRRRRVLALVRDAVEHFKRAVRIGDVLSYTSGKPEVSDLDTQTITHDVLSLAHTEDLRIVGIVRGEENGNNLYLPSELDPALYMPSGPLTWLEEVARAFREIWVEHLKQAEDENRRPRPVSTGEVRAKWITSPNSHPKSRERQPVVNAMAILAKNSRKQPPLVRKIRRKGEKALLWAPVDVPDESLDIGDAHASDAERIGTAVRRAVEQLGRPVTIRDITDEVDLDPSLRPASSISLFKILADTAKERIDAGKGRRKQRVTRRIYRVGTVENETYYYHHAERLNEARAYVEFQRIESRWLIMHAEERLESLSGCMIPSMAIGGARLIIIEAQSFCGMLDDFLCRQLDGVTRNEARDLRKLIGVIMDKARKCIALYEDVQQELPVDVSTDIPCWTAEKLFPVLYPLYPVLQNGKDHINLSRLLFSLIRRIPNPDFEHRFSKKPHGAAEFLFDRTDALIYAAKKWGGYECSFQAKTASDSLGWLRDVRYVFPALHAQDIRIRLTGIACLAFLWSIEGNECLRQLAVEDPEPGVRQSALWAYGFAGGKDVQELLRERSSNDANFHVRDFAKKAMTLDERGWWAF
jgi:hypothetical protein